MRAPTKALGSLLLAAALVAGVSTTANATTVTLSSGHVDVLDIDYSGGALTLDLLDSTTATAVDRAPSDVVLDVPLAAKHTNVPTTPAWSFLGTGGTAWILPQSQTAGLLWPGWNATDVPAGVFQNNQVKFELTAVSGPAGFSIYTAAGSTPTKLADSDDGLPDSVTVAAGSHTHANWGFDAAGTYLVTFKVSGVLASNGQTVSSAPQQYTFHVLNA
ncbi:choice-of-anchor M domain-containing protein [Kitasatospora sp. NRRL B-11411]|uniref:choice-of-anchor M domain-containing protein n=1 Tax=Kitasatospora sp. NRRL B-11411 TaxID=1463822 RepID=UPI0004C3A2D3|nr:choice-of-anchor M domain-containing protein [Kitasatospora sp. NRRL B-11411]